MVISKMYAHPSGRILLISVQENSESSNKKYKTLFYSVLKDQSFLSRDSINSNIQCVEFLDHLLPHSKEFTEMDANLGNKFYACLLGCKNGDLYYASFFNEDPVRVELIRLYGFVRKSNSGNAQMSSIKIIKLFVPKHSEKR